MSLVATADDGCAVEGCASPARVRSWCRKHYMRWWRTGDANHARQAVAGQAQQDALDRWMAKVEQQDGGCWKWTGATARGHGRFAVRPQPGRHTYVSAARWGYEVLVRALPADEVLEQRCGTPLCVNPEHRQPVKRRELRGRQLPLCPNGHDYDLVDKAGSRRCRTCINDAQRARYALRRGNSQRGAAD